MIETRSQRLERRVALVTLLTPAAGSVGAVAYAWTWGVPAHAIASGSLLYVLTMIGIGCGFHRLVTHRAFRAPTWVRDALVVLGSMSAEGPVLFWTVAHRRHHEASDAAGDPHSPHRRGEESLSGSRGFWHAQLGWMLNNPPQDYGRYGKDLLRDRGLLSLSYLYPVWVALGFALPAIVGLVAEHSARGILAGFLFGGCLRMFLAHHATWLVNSVCHTLGKQRYRTGDQSRNVGWVALLTLGEGWHNNHHAFPTSARHGLTWWQLDVSYLTIRLLEMIGLADSVRVPTLTELQKKSLPALAARAVERNLEQ